MKFRALTPALRRAILPLLSLIIFSTLAGCGGSGSTPAANVGGAKVDPEVEAQNQAAIETYNREKTTKKCHRHSDRRARNHRARSYDSYRPETHPRLVASRF